MAMYHIVKDHTMVCPDSIGFNVGEVERVNYHHIPGCFVECGVWKGGSSLAMMIANRDYPRAHPRRMIHCFDSFEGLPPAEFKDGPLAIKWQAEHPDNCRASEIEVDTLFFSYGFCGGVDFKLYPGWFHETLPRWCQTPQPIAILRLDGDWYKSTAACLKWMLPHVVEGGTVIIDDYYAWDGCARAVHDHLSFIDTPYRIKTVGYNAAAYFIKE